jgi:hypothetical protein
MNAVLVYLNFLRTAGRSAFWDVGDRFPSGCDLLRFLEPTGLTLFRTN